MILVSILAVLVVLTVASYLAAYVWFPARVADRPDEDSKGERARVADTSPHRGDDRAP